MEYLTHEGEKIPYQIIKTSRKTISIHIDKNGISVRCPRQITKEKIAELVAQKQDWILKKYYELKLNQVPKEKVEYKNGSKIQYRGYLMELELLPVQTNQMKENQARMWLQEGKVKIESSSFQSDFIKSLLEQWYRMEAKKRICERVEYYTKNYDFKKKVNKITIKDQKSKWGSCSSKCNLNFNYRLIMAPDDVLDYIVVHELCHFLHMNHSSQFWESVKTILPNYEKQKLWLKKNGAKLEIV